MSAQANQCPRCVAAGQPPYFGSPRECAFTALWFSPSNWQCATALALRELCETVGYRTRYNDASLGVVPTEGGFLVLTWYKDRGATGQILVMCDDHPPRPATLADADEAIAYHAALAASALAGAR